MLSVSQNNDDNDNYNEIDNAAQETFMLSVSPSSSIWSRHWVDSLPEIDNHDNDEGGKDYTIMTKMTVMTISEQRQCWWRFHNDAHTITLKPNFENNNDNDD